MVGSTEGVADRGTVDTRAAALRFIIAGGTNTALGFVCFRALLRAFGGRPEAAGLAQAVSYAIGVAIAYAVNRAWTFRGHDSHGHGRALPRFLATYFGSLALSVALVQFGAAVLRLHPSLCWVIATIVTTAVNFVAQRYWVFAQGPL